MERLTERHAGVAVIKDKSRQKDAMEALARYEETGLTPEEIMDGKMLTGWIPVEDRLPEESLNSVIGWDEYRKRCCFVQYYCGRWILGNDVDSVKITAWMPLPEPYTEQTKGSETT